MPTSPARTRLRALALTVALIAVAPALVASPAGAILRTITNTSPPTVVVGASGVPEVGKTVTAAKGTWNPSSGVDFAYQWLADGADIASATTPSLAVTASLLGKKLSVRVTGSGFLDTPGTATSQQTAAVQNPTMRNLSLPNISGTPKIDSTLGAGTGTWSPAGTYAYQWLADGAVIEGATSLRLTLSASEVSKKISVRITASKEGFLSGTATSAQTTAVLPGVVTNSVAPTLFGTFKVGKTVGVNPNSWSPANVEWTYRWFANGVLIPGVTTKTFALDPSLVGKSLRAEVTGSRSGYTSAVANSATSAPITCSAVAPATLTKGGATTSRIRINWTKASCAKKYVVSYRLANAKTYKQITVGDVSTYVFTGLTRARSYRIRIASIGVDGVQSAPTASILAKTAS